MTKGRVKWFNEAKGFGWIESEDGKPMFVHYNEIVSSKPRKTLEAGQSVRCESFPSKINKVDCLIARKVIVEKD